LTSQVQFCNLALSRLGANRITSLTDGTAEADLCNIFFDDIADQVMSEGSWSSTIFRVELAQTTNTPSFGYANEFQLPVDPKAIKILNIDEAVPGGIDYRIEGDKLLSDEGTMKIRYIGRLTDTEDWDIYLGKAFISRLASELAYPLTGDTRKAELEYARYQAIVDEALAQNGQQGSKEEIISVDFTEVR
jgi:hypothetical protein